MRPPPRHRLESPAEMPAIGRGRRWKTAAIRPGPGWKVALIRPWRSLKNRNDPHMAAHGNRDAWSVRPWLRAVPRRPIKRKRAVSPRLNMRKRAVPQVRAFDDAAVTHVEDSVDPV